MVTSWVRGGRFHLNSTIKTNLSRFLHRTWALNNLQLRIAFEKGLIELPDISSQNLAKLDRGENLAKLLALLQMTYLIIQLIARKMANLPSTQLEIATVAFAAVSMITYLLYWARPQGVDSVHVIQAKKIPDGHGFRLLLARSAQYLWTYARLESRADADFDVVPLPNDGVFPIFHDLDWGTWLVWAFGVIGRNEEAVSVAFGAVIGGILFGGLHCLAWDLPFPTSAEATSWKVCSILTTGLPILSIVPFGYWQRLDPNGVSFKLHALELWLGVRMIKVSTGLILSILLATYILARLFLMVEIFRSLFFLPPEAFIDTWTGAFPHFTG
jgi:hypothetical protein